MTLAEIRSHFIKRSGRYDLITQDGQDNGANFFIQSGSRFLDRHADVRKAQEGSSIHGVGQDGLLRLTDCWLIESVLANIEGGWRHLRKLASRSSLQARFVGIPTFYAVKTIRHSLPLTKLPASQVTASASAFDQQDMASTALLLEILPHPHDTLTVDVRGSFYAAPLQQDTDTNTWSELYPDTLIKAALYQLEIFYRNTEGANDWLVSIQLDLRDAEHLEILSDIQHKDTMGL